MDCGIGADGARALSEALKVNSTITSISLGCHFMIPGEDVGDDDVLFHWQQWMAGCDVM